MIKWRHGFITCQFYRHPLDRRQLHHTMRKMRDDSAWNRLTLVQLALLDDWLFKDRLGYAKALALVEKEFGLQVSVSSMGRYYRRRMRVRQAANLVTAQVTADELNALPVNMDDIRKAISKALGCAVLQMAAEEPENVEMVVKLASAFNVLLKGEENDIRRQRLKLAEMYFDFEKAAAFEEELPQARAQFLAISRDPNLSDKEKTKRLNKLLFGSDYSKLDENKSEENKSDENEPDKSENGKYSISY
jgi:hypothetical protein